MFCHNCGTKISDDAEYCYHCGTKVEKINTIRKWFCPVCDYVHEGDAPPEKCPQCGIPGSTFTEQDIKSQPLQPEFPNARKLLCPKCHSSDLVPITETRTDVSGGGYGVGKGCCGWILLGPFGLLCGLCGTKVKSHTRTITSWVCKDCGNKFRNPMDVEAEENAEENAERMTSGISTLGGSIILYIVGNLLSDNGLELFGIPNWIYITLGILGAILGAFLMLMSIIVGMFSDMDEAKELAKNVFSVAVVVSIASFLGGIIFAIMGIRFFWMPAWVYILFGLLGGILFAFLLLMAWASLASDEELDAFDKKYGPLFQKIFNKNK